MPDLPPADAALLRLLQALRERGYAFVTPTPETHGRNLARRVGDKATSLRDVFGWSLPFDESFEPELVALLRDAELIENTPDGPRSAVRVSTLGGRLFLHSAYPTEAEDAVFFGPDSYRFAHLITDELQGACPERIVDVGAGSGVGALVAAGLCPDAEIVMTDVNPRALRLAHVNAAFAGVEATFLQGDGVQPVEGAFDLALLNPPYIQDDEERQYRHGGALHGGQLSIDLAEAICARLSPGGRLILYTGSAIVDGRDQLRKALETRLPDCALRYREIDPDVFGEELDRDAYADVERIAVVAAVLTRSR